MNGPPPDLSRRVEVLLHKRAVTWRRVERGYTPAQRWVAVFDDGTSVFIKGGDDRMPPGAVHTTAYGLRREHRVYRQLPSAKFIPRMLGWLDDEEGAILVLEDLTHARWPPPWDDASVAAVLQALDEVHGTRLFDAPTSEENFAVDIPVGWPDVARDPRPLLSLGLCTKAWLERTLPVLVGAGESVPGQGEDFCHWDVRSDNLCLVDTRAVLIDWNWATTGNGRLDLAFWLPSLHAEGGPSPETILPDSPGLAAVVSGFFAARAGLPAIPALPRVRDVQLQQLGTALPWAQRALGLPPLDGANAS